MNSYKQVFQRVNVRQRFITSSYFINVFYVDFIWFLFVESLIYHAMLKSSDRKEMKCKQAEGIKL